MLVEIVVAVAVIFGSYFMFARASKKAKIRRADESVGVHYLPPVRVR